MTNQHHVFLSYSRRDSEMMARVRDGLRLHGLRVWTDEALTPGTPSWKDAIEDAIAGAACLVVLMSPDAKKSTWVEREVEYATMLGKLIFPLLVRGEEAEAVPLELVNVDRADARRDAAEGINDLIAAVRAYVNAPSAAQQTQADAFQERLREQFNRYAGQSQAGVQDLIDRELARMTVVPAVPSQDETLRSARAVFIDGDERRHGALILTARALAFQPARPDIPRFELPTQNISGVDAQPDMRRYMPKPAAGYGWMTLQVTLRSGQGYLFSVEDVQGWAAHIRRQIGG